MRPRDGRSVLLVALLGVVLCFAESCASGPNSGHQPREQHVVLHPTTAATTGPRVLAVVAHPDDEILFAGTLFENARALHGTSDLFTITNGEGGFKYSTLAQHVYDLPLVEEEVGRAHLPRIRWQELQQSARILFVHSLTSLGERDHRYTQDVHEVLAEDADVWDLARIRTALDRELDRGYDFVLTMAPTATTHGHHQASALLALEAVARRPAKDRPVILCARTTQAQELPEPLELVSGFPLATLRRDRGPYRFDRTRRFGHRDSLTYTVLVDMAIGAHLSQGSVQLLHGQGDFEEYHLYTLDDDAAAMRAQVWFDALSQARFPGIEYGSSAGTNASSGGSSR